MAATINASTSPAGTYTIDEDVGATVTISLNGFYGSGTGEVDVTSYAFGGASNLIEILASPNP